MEWLIVMVIRLRLFEKLIDLYCGRIDEVCRI